MKVFIPTLLPLVFLISALVSCISKSNSHEEMIKLLDEQQKQYNKADNYYASEAQVQYYDSLIRSTESFQDKMMLTYNKCYALIALGREEDAIILLEEQVSRIDRDGIKGMNKLKVQLALAYLRAGERANCILNHSAETCILPIQGEGIHKIPEGSRNAIRIYESLLEEYPDNMEYRWLLNIAYMTLGDYPSKVPEKYLIPGLDSAGITDSSAQVEPFVDMAGPLKLDVNNMAGGTIVDDFDNDGYLDIVTSSWDLDVGLNYFRNNQHGGFIDESKSSRLNDLRGGLNLLQMDFNNDGYKDIFVLRGAWLRGNYGKQPNSLIKNNGDGTFTDITTQSGLLSFHPTQTATWNDFNNDGWVDVFIGNETWEGNAASGEHPCELYLNNHDDTFTNVAEVAGCAMTGFIKGVTSGDFDNDGWQDIFISSLSGQRYLLKNKGVEDKIPKFEDVTDQSRINDGVARTFPAWFWDYNNDGWLDIGVGDFTFDKPISSYSAEVGLGLFNGTSGTIRVYKNNRDGTFENVSMELGTNKPAFAMSANFGDIDNDGFSDFYLGTGNPELESIVPNKMFKNLEGKKFMDITTFARVGHLQKGHGIAFADIDNDGDQDIYIELGGAYKGDGFHNSFYLNPGQQNKNSWITLDLEGKNHRNVIGTRIKVSFKEDGHSRAVYCDVNSGASFGASPLRQEMGLGKAQHIDKIEIHWHPSRNVQVFENVEPNRFLRLREDVDTLQTISLKTLDFNTTSAHMHH
jgi:tetratricopeptide (TPR) repeat protein